MSNKILKIVYTAVVAALTCVMTMFVRVPTGIGYIHLGDTMLFIGVYLVGAYAIGAAALGAMIADLVGFPVFAVPTLIIKLLAAGACWLIIRKNDRPLYVLIGAIVGCVVNIVGYFVVEIFMFGIGGAMAELPLNGVQAAFAIGVSFAATVSLHAIKFKKRIKL